MARKRARRLAAAAGAVLGAALLCRWQYLEGVSDGLALAREKAVPVRVESPAPAFPRPAPAPARTPREAQQHYLSGVIYYQKGDFERARQEWLLAKAIEPHNQDVLAGLSRLGGEEL